MEKEKFIKKANKFCFSHLGHNAFTQDDEFDVLEHLENAIKEKQSPEQFVMEMFREDFWKIEYEESQYQESIENFD